MHDHGVLKTLLLQKVRPDGRVTVTGGGVLDALLLLACHIERIIAQPGGHRVQARLNDLVDLGEQRQLVRLLRRKIERVGFSHHRV